MSIERRDMMQQARDITSKLEAAGFPKSRAVERQVLNVAGVNDAPNHFQDP